MTTHMTQCPRCRTGMGTVTFDKLRKATTPDSYVVYATAGKGVRDMEHALGQLGMDYSGMVWSRVEDNEPIPAGAPCSSCRMQALSQKAEVDKGGVYFLCSSCGMQGVLRAGSKMAMATRKELGVSASAPCSAKVTDCAAHSPTKAQPTGVLTC